ncbi:MAG: peptidylprolyl isomerase [Pikeienuella sp.]|uniref:peptidylprolyl isomerase n=1 Tax=Pikeienuella sp. TaxID=2831957 RepID=UPI00391C9BE6
MTGFSAMARRIAAGVLALFLLAPGAGAQTAFAPAVVVNDDIITWYDIEQRARLLQVNGAEGGPRLNAAALEQLIDDRLRLQAGERFNLSASPQEVESGRAEFAGRIGVDQSTLTQRMSSLDVAPGALDSFVESQIVWRKLVNGRFANRATPTEVELDQEIAIAASGTTRSFRLSELAIPSGPGQEAAARGEVERVLDALSRGQDFAALARRFSRAPSAANGGDVGWVPETVLPPGLAEIIAATPPGGVTQPIETPGAISLYRVEDTRSETPPWARETEMSLRRVMVPIGEGGEDAARAQAEEIRAQTQGCGDIGGPAAEAVVEPIDAKLVSTLPGPVRDVVRLLQSGQASRPVTSESSVDIFVVCSRTGGVDDATRAQLREQIRDQRLARLAEGYLQELRREAVIERR